MEEEEGGGAEERQSVNVERQKDRGDEGGKGRREHIHQ